MVLASNRASSSSDRDYGHAHVCVRVEAAYLT